MSAAIGAALAGARTMTATSSQGLALMAEVVYIAASMRAPIVMALGNRALSGPDQHPLRPLRLDADPRLRRDPALRRERAGGVRPDRDRAAARRASRRAAAGARLPGRLHDHALRRAGRAACRRRRPRASSAITGFRTPCSTSARPTTQGPFAMPDYYYEFRRQQAAAIEASEVAFGDLGVRVRTALRPHATARSRSTGSTAPRPRSSRSARPPAP